MVCLMSSCGLTVICCVKLYGLFGSLCVCCYAVCLCELFMCLAAVIENYCVMLCVVLCVLLCLCPFVQYVCVDCL